MKLHDRLQQMQLEIAQKRGETDPISLRELGVEAGLSPATLTQIVRNSESGKEGGYKSLRACAEFWGYSVDWLISGRGERKQKSLGALEQALAAESWDPVAVAAALAARDAGRGADWTVARWQTFLREAHELFARTEKAQPTATAPVAKPSQIKRSQR